MISRIKLFKNKLLNQPIKGSFTIEAIVTGETAKTIRIYYRNQEVWLQKSLVNIQKQNGSKVKVSMPLWLYVHKFSK